MAVLSSLLGELDLTRMLGSVLAFALLCIGTWASYLIYFHPLAPIPGPRHWAVSRLFFVWSLYRGRVAMQLKELHERYGPVIRVSPDEVSFIDEKAWSAFYAYRQGSCLEKSPIWFGARYRPNDPHEKESYGIMSAKNVDHPRFRRAFAPSFTDKSLKAHEPMIQKHVGTLISQLRRESLKGIPLNIFQWFQYITFDVTGELGYSKSFHTLESAENRSLVSILGSFLKPYSKECGLRTLGLPAKLQRQLSVSHDALQGQIAYSQSLGRWVHERLAEGNTPGKPDLMTYFAKNSNNKGLSIYETENAIRDFMIAGTETVSETLLAIFYHLVRNQEILSSLTNEIRQSFTDENTITADAVAKLPLLNAVTNEAMRLAPSIPAVMPRFVAEPGMEACGYWLPAGTFINFCQFAAYRSPANFYSPAEFIPARWLDSDKKPHNADIFHPFSVGPRDCIGKSFALIEIRVIVARLLWNFDLSPGEDNWEWTSQPTYFAWEKRPLYVKLSARSP